MNWRVIPVGIAFLFACTIGAHAVTSHPGAAAMPPIVAGPSAMYQTYEPNW